MVTISMATNTNNHSTLQSPSLPSQEKQVDHPWSPGVVHITLMSMPEPPKGDLDMLMESLDNCGLSTTNTTTSETQMFDPSLLMEENNVVISNCDPMLLHQTKEMKVSQPTCDMWENNNLQLLEVEEMEQGERHDGGVVTLPPMGPTLMEESRSDGRWGGTTLVPSLKGFPWTEVEHRMFLLGLEHHGKGNWKMIAKEFVPTRSPTQVASHAQKFFKRHGKCKPHRRPSIHDITTSHGPAPCCVRSIAHSHIYHQLLDQIPISSNYNNNMTYQHVMNMDMNINTNTTNMITNTYTTFAPPSINIENTNMYNDNNMVEQVGAPDQPNPIEGASSSVQPEGLVEDYDAIEQFLAQLEVDDYLNSCGTSSISTDFLPL